MLLIVQSETIWEVQRNVNILGWARACVRQTQIELYRSCPECLLCKRVSQIFFVVAMISSDALVVIRVQMAPSLLKTSCHLSYLGEWAILGGSRLPFLLQRKVNRGTLLSRCL